MGEPPADPEGRPSPPRSSVGARVVTVTVLSAALGGLLAALMAIVAVDELIEEHADQRLRAALFTLADELDEDESRAKLRAKLVRTLEDENGEIATSGIHLSVFEGTRHLAGYAPRIVPPRGACKTTGELGSRARTCSRAYRGLLLVSEQRSDRLTLLWYYALALALGVLLGGSSGALFSGALTRWALGPLLGVAARLRAFEPERLETVRLGPPSQLREVRAIQEAVGALTDNVRMLLGQAQSFAANAAHELRTPLTTIRAELELMAEEAIRTEDRAALERTSTQVKRLGTLVERLLVLALPPAELGDGFEAVSMCDVVQEVYDERIAVERARLQLHAESEGVVRGDAALLASMVTNAVENALRYTEGPVEVSIRQIEEEVVVEVVDQGPGMSPDESIRALEPFYRAGSRAAKTGFGLGLALLSHVARAHEGRVDLDSNESGTRVSFRLPMWRARDEAEVGGPGASRRPRPLNSGSR